MKNSHVFILFFILIASLGMGTCPSQAQESITFGPRETKIIGSIPYTVIGKYQARFSDFKGRITLDEKSRRIESVYLEIEANSIKSNCPWCDKVARSRRLLHTALYPKIIFKSDQIIKDENGYKVKGFLEMHGIRRRMTFPFKAGIIFDRDTQRKYLDIKGDWIINRKDFNIVWSRTLDHGGVVVGDDFTVNWRVSVPEQFL